MTLQTSTIIATNPVQSAKLASAPVRNNFGFAYNDITNIYAILGVQAAGSTVGLVGGTADNLIIGGTTPASGSFTTLNSTGGAVNATIGGTTPKAGAFTTISATGNVNFSGTGNTLGTITSGTWNAGVISGQYGGTGVANTGKTITLGGNLTTSGAYTTTLTMTGATSLTLPTSGTVTALGNATTGSGSIVLATNPSTSGLTDTSSITLTNNQNAATNFIVNNNSTGSTASVGYIVNATTGTSGYLSAFGSGSGTYPANSVVLGTGSPTPLIFATNSGERARIDSSGNFGIGTTSTGSYKFNVVTPGTNQAYFGSIGTNYSSIVIDNAAGGNQSNIFLTDAGAIKWQITKDTNNHFYIGDNAAGKYVLTMVSGGALNLGNYQGFSIDQNGQVSISVASSSYIPVIIITPNTGTGLNFQNFSGTATYTAAKFFTNGNGTQVGSISVTSTATAYNTSSDARRKTVIGEIDSGTILDALNPVKFKWNSNNQEDHGVLAQEAHKIYPWAVTAGINEELTDQGDPKNPWAVDYSKFVPLLLAETKKLRLRCAELETKLGITPLVN